MSDPTTRSLAAQVAAHTSWAGTSDRAARTARARAALNTRFEDEVDPERTLTDEERAERVKHARSAYFARLALTSHANRRKAAELLAAADDADRTAEETR